MDVTLQLKIYIINGKCLCVEFQYNINNTMMALARVKVICNVDSSILNDRGSISHYSFDKLKQGDMRKHAVQALNLPM